MANALYQSYLNRQAHAVHLQVQTTTGNGVNPIVVTTTVAHNLTTGDYAKIQGVLGNTAANGDWVITVTGSTTFSISATGNGTYTSGGSVSNAVDLLGDNIRVVLVDIRGGHYSVTLATDQFLSVISAADRQDALSGGTTTSPFLASKTVASGGQFAAATTTMPLVAADTRSLGAVVMYVDPFGTQTPSSGQAGVSLLIAYIDTATGLPIIPSGGDISFVWASYIFAL